MIVNRVLCRLIFCGFSCEKEGEVFLVVCFRNNETTTNDIWVLFIQKIITSVKVFSTSDDDVAGHACEPSDHGAAGCDLEVGQCDVCVPRCRSSYACHTLGTTVFLELESQTICWAMQ